MAEIQRSGQTEEAREMTRHFLGLVMMQAQQAALFLGQIPNPQTGKTEINLELARMFIDQLEMLREKTRNNLTSEESGMLANVLSDLQVAFVKAAESSTETTPQPAGPTAPPAEVPPAPPAASPETPAEEEPESRKKFTKSYGS
jgi:hypothetical protein